MTEIIQDRQYELRVTGPDGLLIITPPTQIEFELNIAIYTEFSMGSIKVYNPSQAMKDALMNKYPAGDARNDKLIELVLLRGNSTVANVLSPTDQGYQYTSRAMGFLYHSVEVKVSPIVSYLEVVVLSVSYSLMSKPVNENEEGRGPLLNKLQNMFREYGYSFEVPVIETTKEDKNREETFSASGNLWEETQRHMMNEQLILYTEQGVVRVADGKANAVAKNSSGVGEISFESGLMNYPRQVNNDIIFQHTFDRKFMLDSYITIPTKLINLQLANPSPFSNNGYPLPVNSSERYRVIRYSLVGSYLDMAKWYQVVYAQVGRIPLANNLNPNSTAVGEYIQ